MVQKRNFSSGMPLVFLRVSPRFPATCPLFSMLHLSVISCHFPARYPCGRNTVAAVVPSGCVNGRQKMAPLPELH